MKPEPLSDARLRVEKGGVMKVIEWLSLVSAIGKLILLAIEIRNARRDNDGRSDTS